MEADKLPISIYVSLIDYDFDDIKDFPGVTEDNWYEFEEEAWKLIVWHFKLAFSNLMPLTNQLTLKHISIGIDIFEMTGGSAGYYHHASDKEKGNYGFYIGGGLLAEYMTQYQSDGNPKSIDEHTWEHELIHLLDHNQITSHQLFFNSRDLREFFVHLFLRFRNEGMAELFHFVRKPKSVNNPLAAQQLLRDELKCFINSAWEDETQYEQLKNRFLESGLPYTVGSWMVVHSLTCSQDETISNFSINLVKRLLNNEAISKDDLIQLIEFALKIDNSTFLAVLTKQNVNGDFFIEPDLMESCIQRINELKPFKLVDEYDKQMTLEKEANLKLFTIL